MVQFPPALTLPQADIHRCSMLAMLWAASLSIQFFRVLAAPQLDITLDTLPVLSLFVVLYNECCALTLSCTDASSSCLCSCEAL